MTIPHITKEQARAAFINAGAPTELMRVYNERIDAANLAAQPEEEYITAEQARALGFGNAEYRGTFEEWHVCSKACIYLPDYIYRAIKKPEPTPVDPHAGLRAEYAKQEAEGTLRFFKWEFMSSTGKWTPTLHFNDLQDQPTWHPDNEYQFTDISCLVGKGNEKPIRMLRTEAVELHRSLGDTVDWFTPFGNTEASMGESIMFDRCGVFTYRTKATIKLDGKLVTPAQAAAEWEAKKDTHDLHFKFFPLGFTKVEGLAKDMARYFSEQADRVEYELRAKKAKPEPQIFNWRNMPVGVAVIFTDPADRKYAGILLGENTHTNEVCFDVQSRRSDNKGFYIHYCRAGNLELAPASEQPLIARNGTDPKHIYALNGLYVTSKYVDGDLFAFKVIGLLEGWAFK